MTFEDFGNQIIAVQGGTFVSRILIGGDNMFASVSKLILKLLHRSPGAITNSDVDARIAELSDKRADDITIRFSRGNISLQEGAVVSAREIDKEFGPAPWRN